VPGYETSTWFAFLAPAGTPRPIVDKIRKALIDTLHDPAVVQAFDRDGSDIETTTPEELTALIKADYERYGELIRGLDIKE
jgi:tripartite-type tricarboxylate transporter receptor subunit TctC